jgi:serine/threonine protein kinase
LREQALPMMREVNAGDKLDQYQLTELIARSGMASIFKAVDRVSGTTVAIKVPYLQFESDVVFYGRFKREEEVGRRLDHPNIIKVLTPRHKSRMYIAMEYVDGISLRAIMRDERPLRTERALDFARQICDAMVYMHSQGVIHRDLKPENVLVTADGKVKLMDFGIALDESARRLTWTGLSTTIGTPDYMAPEQINGRHGDARTDVYALGTMLFEMVTGDLPFSGSNVYAMLRAKTGEDPQPPSGFVPNVDPHLEEIILRAIERLPRNRYQTAVEMLEDLNNPERVHLAGRAKRLHPRSLRARRVRRVLWMVLFFSSLAAIFVLLIWIANRFPAVQPRAGQSFRGR